MEFEEARDIKRLEVAGQILCEFIRKGDRPIVELHSEGLPCTAEEIGKVYGALYRTLYESML